METHYIAIYGQRAEEAFALKMKRRLYNTFRFLLGAMLCRIYAKKKPTSKAEGDVS